MTKIILEQLQQLQQREHIRILFACESGSRAWGFHSPDSDYDVRFAYVHTKDWYIGIEDKKDFIEFPKDVVLDITGYDIRKLLKLFRSSNAKIFEWIQSPVLYLKEDSFLKGLQSLVEEYYSSKSGIHHYLGLTRNTFETYLQGEHIRLKKYFYALRPILAALWIVEKDECPPMEFHHLRTLITDPVINKKIDGLLQQKAEVGESFVIAPDEVLHQFIADQMKRCELFAQGLPKKETSAASLNLLFRTAIGI
jgi:hypothetical protein